MYAKYKELARQQEDLRYDFRDLGDQWRRERHTGDRNRIAIKIKEKFERSRQVGVAWDHRSLKKDAEKSAPVTQDDERLQDEMDELGRKLKALKEELKHLCQSL